MEVSNTKIAQQKPPLGLCRVSVGCLDVAKWIKLSGKLLGEEIRGIEHSRLCIVKLGLRREKAHWDTIERPYG